MIDSDLVREHFPRHPRGYFDTAAVGAVPRPVAAAVQDVAAALERGTLGSSAWHEIVDDTLPLLAGELAADPSRTIALSNTSTAMNAVARAVQFSAEDEVLTFADDFPSPRLPWLSVVPGRVREVSPALGDERTDTLISALNSSTRVVSVTHVHASTGTTLDLARLAAACQEVDALLVVDGAQSAGLIPASAAHADVFVGASYKWMLAGFGTAVVATSARFDAIATPGLIGYRNITGPGLEVGHSNLFGLAALGVATRVRHAIGVNAILSHTRQCMERIKEDAVRLGYTMTSEYAAAGILGVAVRDPDGAAARLRERGSVVAVRSGALRISPSLITTTNDLDRLADALADLSSLGHTPLWTDSEQETR